jgi:hypothetical protein
MIKQTSQTSSSSIAAVRARRLEMQHMQVIEGNPLTAGEISMFEMFEREGWTHERRRAHILAQFKRRRPPEAAE